jgi:hypothetical protein
MIGINKIDKIDKIVGINKIDKIVGINKIVEINKVIKLKRECVKYGRCINFNIYG